MTIAVVPVKALALAKSRLAARLADDARRALVLAMLQDVLGALAAVGSLSAIWVIGHDGDREVRRTAADLGAEWVPEPQSVGYNEAVAMAARRIGACKARAMLVVPGDIPGLSPNDVAAILTALPVAPSAAVLVPSRDGRGTNAALLAPPAAFPLRFGEPSFDAHCASASAHGVTAAVLHVPGAALDIDTPDDLERFAARASHTHTHTLLQQLATALHARAPEPATTS